MIRNWRRFLWLMAVAALLFYLVPRAARALYPLPYIDIITFYAHREGIDPLLVAAVTRVESKFYPYAQSEQGARGLMQLMPETAKLAAEHLKLPYKPDLLFNPEYNLRLGCWYLAALLREFDNLPIALAAYNGGRGNVHSWLEEGIWDGSLQNLDKIPFGETREFVRRVLLNYRIYRFLYPHIH